MSEHVLLLTGVTGFVGRELLHEVLTRTDMDVVCLVRANGAEHAQQRVRETVAELYGRDASEVVRPRVEALHGDVTSPTLDIDPTTRQQLVERLTHVIHGAASVRFDLPLHTSRRINVHGTEAVLRLARACAERGRLERFGYVSTAFVAGRHPEVFAENDLNLGQPFRNTYERSKCEAEMLVSTQHGHLPTTVVRPSIVVGHSRHGSTTSWNTLYWPLRIYASARWRHVPARADLPVDVVPVDHVCRGTVEAVLGHGREGATYALAAGGGAPTAGEVAALAATVLDAPEPWLVSTPLDRVVLPMLVQALSIGPFGSFARALRQYLPYFHDMPRFDTTHADALLHPHGIAVPPAREFLEPVIRYAIDTDFGHDTAAKARRRTATLRARRRELMASASGPHPPRVEKRRIAGDVHHSHR